MSQGFASWIGRRARRAEFAESSLESLAVSDCPLDFERTATLEWEFDPCNRLGT